MKVKPKITPCWECGDRITFTVPNPEFLKLVLENGYADVLACTKWIEIGYPFVLTIMSNEGTRNILGERGDAIVFDRMTNEWSVKWKA